LKKKLQASPIFFLLLPVFFILHGFTENFYAVPVGDAVYLLGIYILASLIIFSLGWLFYRNSVKAALFSFCTMAFHFFFGSVQDILKRNFDESFITHYRFIIPFFLACFILLIIFMKRTKRKFIRVSLFLNILLCLLILIDAGWLIQKNFSKKEVQAIGDSRMTLSCDNCIKPDIYLLLFDEYSSSTALRELWNYDNSDLDSFLLQKGFAIQPFSKSNYNFTPFSMASTLNMDFLKIPNPEACTVKDYTQCFSLIKKNRVCSLLKSMGYKIVNYSIFDIDKEPSPVIEDFLPLKTKLITSQTFISRIKKDLYYHLLVGKFEIPWLSKNLIYTTYNNNKKIINATLKESTTISQYPRFIYSHIEMPHPPFYFNRKGKQTDKKILIEENNKAPASSYLDYIPKTNKVLKQIVNSIIKNAKRPFVIIFMGDHGFRTKQPKEYYFRNQNAVYFSFTNQKHFYPNITNVNEFRILFNDLFHTSLPLLKDSTVFLIDK
jgi:hypothetical protein